MLCFRLEISGQGEEVIEVKSRGLCGVSVDIIETGNEKCSARERAPDDDLAATFKLSEDPLAKEPFRIVVVLVEMEQSAEGREVTCCEGMAQGEEFLPKAKCFWLLEKVDAGKATEDYIRSDKIDEDEAALFEAAGVALIIRSLECELSAEEVTVSKVITTQVV